MAGKKGRSGRPKFKYNIETVRQACMLHPTDEELAAFLKCSADTIARLRQNDPVFLQAYEEGKSHGKLSLRRRQMSAALEGNTTMLVWLGKQLLGQADKQDLGVEMKQPPKVELVLNAPGTAPKTK